ncbi:Prohibitin-4, mitochondrial, partial [Cucurbita argyrosperma subsp. sororia]
MMNSFFSRTTHLLTKVAGFAVGVGVVSSVVNASMYTVRMGERAVIFHPFGGRTDNTIVGEGTHFCIPWLQKPSIFNIRVRPYTFSFVSYTKDRQEVTLTVRVLFHPDIPYLPHNHQTLPSINHKDLDAVVSKFTSHELVANLMDVSALIREALAARATESHIVLDYVSFTNVSFSPEFSRACESEQVAQQRQKMLLLREAKEEENIRAATVWDEAFKVAVKEETHEKDTKSKREAKWKRLEEIAAVKSASNEAVLVSSKVALRAPSG